jgi:hypothetical protein
MKSKTAIAALAAAGMLASFAGESRAETGCSDPCTATINFNYSGAGSPSGDFTTASGSGSFTVPVGPDANPTPGLGDLNGGFNFTQTTESSFLGFPSTFNYGPGTLTSFSLNFANPQPLSFGTSAVATSSSNSIYVPESFQVLGSGSGQTSNYLGRPLTQGPVTLDQASLTKAIMQNAVTVSPDLTQAISRTGQPTIMTALFTPNFGLTVQQAATLMGFAGVGWQQTVLVDPTHNVFLNSVQPVALQAPYPDPPPGGILGTPTDSYPFYAPNGIKDELAQQGSKTYSFDDQPADLCFSVAQPCFGDRQLSPTSVVVFDTRLVGVLSDGSGFVPGPTLFEFQWTSNYSGDGSNVGGVSCLPFSSCPGRREGFQFDSGNGTGGVAVLSEPLGVPDQSPVLACPA